MEPHVACEALLSSIKSLCLSTCNADGEPNIGYTPFVVNDTDLIVFVSQLARHTRDMLETRSVAVLIMADEQDSQQIFARTRLSYRCSATPIAADSPDYNDLLDRYQQQHGKMVDLLRQLPDFVLFQLRPVSGQFVMGFGKAYKLEGEKLDQFVHARTG